MVQMDFDDHYHNLTISSVVSLKFAISKIKEGLKNLKFLMLIDDDNYLNVKKLKQILLGPHPIIKEVPITESWKISSISI